MKKLSTIIALALVLTISGVYAAWSYSQGAAASVEVTREINMAQVNTDGKKGTISVSPTDFAFLVDDAGEYKAGLVGTGRLTINFTPNKGADANVTAINMIATIEIRHKTADGDMYDGKVPIAVDSTNGNYDALKKSVTIDLTNGTPASSVVLEATTITSVLKLADVVLDTKQENDDFHKALQDYTIYITISEVI